MKAIAIELSSASDAGPLQAWLDANPNVTIITMCANQSGIIVMYREAA